MEEIVIGWEHQRLAVILIGIEYQKVAVIAISGEHGEVKAKMIRKNIKSQ